MKVISGGQTGVDRGALKAAKAIGHETCGWMPRGWLAEDGPHPEFAELYGMQVHESADYQARTRANVQAANATLILAGDVQSPGTRLTVQICEQLQKPHAVFGPTIATLHDVRLWLTGVEVLNV